MVWELLRFRVFSGLVAAELEATGGTELEAAAVTGVACAARPNVEAATSAALAANVLNAFNTATPVGSSNGRRHLMTRVLQQDEPDVAAR
jgi:hypothetical protein